MHYVVWKKAITSKFGFNVLWSVEKGNNIKFWDNKWVGDIPFNYNFFRVLSYQIVRIKLYINWGDKNIAADNEI